MSMKSQSDFDSQGGFKFYSKAEEAPKEKSKFLYLLEESKAKETKNKNIKK